MEDILKQLLQEEQELQFSHFNEVTAWQLGSQMVEHAMRENLPVTIDIDARRTSTLPCQPAWHSRGQ